MTAKIHANFSLPLVLLENRIDRNGNNQMKPIINKNTNPDESSIVLNLIIILVNRFWT